MTSCGTPRRSRRRSARRGFPVVLVNVDGGAPGRTEAAPCGGDRPADWAELLAALDPQPDDLRITKRTWGAFHGTPLDEQLEARGVTQVVLTGVATSAGVESTARAAHEHGYHVVVGHRRDDRQERGGPRQQRRADLPAARRDRDDRRDPRRARGRVATS